ncbi:uncharacterized protein BJ171DRAFT_495051 [Polychytrium aggregatum]|uniref:uncharacterized protein n=1 Tax=Polychytrium aggregatum TaxID=110093 RepID=UPI0022FECCB2|nr:uncharacterized protein BJ171DRAFT_495051 [Polychytrium aggregatum]KAI9206884.1 hypothetical protein BJ171DRAFT_495051 [Polychytrium aggregatum]
MNPGFETSSSMSISSAGRKRKPVNYALKSEASSLSITAKPPPAGPSGSPIRVEAGPALPLPRRELRLSTPESRKPSVSPQTPNSQPNDCTPTPDARGLLSAAHETRVLQSRKSPVTALSQGPMQPPSPFASVPEDYESTKNLLRKAEDEISKLRRTVKELEVQNAKLLEQLRDRPSDPSLANVDGVGKTGRFQYDDQVARLLMKADSSIGNIDFISNEISAKIRAKCGRQNGSAHSTLPESMSSGPKHSSEPLSHDDKLLTVGGSVHAQNGLPHDGDCPSKLSKWDSGIALQDPAGRENELASPLQTPAPASDAAPGVGMPSPSPHHISVPDSSPRLAPRLAPELRQGQNQVASNEIHIDSQPASASDERESRNKHEPLMLSDSLSQDLLGILDSFGL